MRRGVESEREERMLSGFRSLTNEMEIVAAEIAAILNKVTTCSGEYIFKR